MAREGTKKTVFINFMELCKSMNRNHEHVLVRAATAHAGRRCAALMGLLPRVQTCLRPAGSAQPRAAT